MEPPPGAMAHAVACYPFDSALDDALDRMTRNEMAVVEAHERGEYDVGLALGEAWDEMLLDLTLTPAELMARAVRDHLADCIHTLPMLIDDGRDASLHLFMANLGAMRKQLFPALERAYRHWLDSGELHVLGTLAQQGRGHWHALALQMLALHREHGVAAARPIAAAVEAATL